VNFSYKHTNWIIIIGIIGSISSIICLFLSLWSGQEKYLICFYIALILMIFSQFYVLNKFNFIQIATNNLISILIDIYNRSNVNKTDRVIMFGDETHYISYENPSSAPIIPSIFLQSPKGSFSIWVYINPQNEGIRNLENNRYILAHDTNEGFKKQIIGIKEKVYENVFALRHNVAKNWDIWLMNSKGESNNWPKSGSDILDMGWHNFLIRWDHGANKLHLLIDGKIHVDCDDYQHFWPSSFCKNIFIGRWQNDKATVHYINTKISRIIYTTEFLDDDFVNQELTEIQKIRGI